MIVVMLLSPQVRVGFQLIDRLLHFSDSRCSFPFLALSNESLAPVPIFGPRQSIGSSVSAAVCNFCRPQCPSPPLSASARRPRHARCHGPLPRNPAPFIDPPSVHRGGGRGDWCNMRGWGGRRETGRGESGHGSIMEGSERRAGRNRSEESQGSERSGHQLRPCRHDAWRPGPTPAPAPARTRAHPHAPHERARGGGGVEKVRGILRAAPQGPP
jgi:hypothetical protein